MPHSQLRQLSLWDLTRDPQALDEALAEPMYAHGVEGEGADGESVDESEGRTKNICGGTTHISEN